MEKLVAPLAYFITWSTYGTRLHGDARGTVDEGYDRPGAPLRPQSVALIEYEEAKLRAEPFTLTHDMRTIIDAVVRDHCGVRRWRLRAVNARSTHVHVVVTAPPTVSAVAIERRLKAWGTRRLRETGLVDPARPIWTRGASKRQIWNEEGLAGAIHYVLNCQ